MPATARPIDQHLEAVKRQIARFFRAISAALTHAQAADEEAPSRALGALIQAIDRLIRSVAKEDCDTRIGIFFELHKLGSPALEILITTMSESQDATLRDLCLKGFVAFSCASRAGATAAVIEAAANPGTEHASSVPREFLDMGERRRKLLEAIQSCVMSAR
jgi:hypothetical protein